MRENLTHKVKLSGASLFKTLQRRIFFLIVQPALKDRCFSVALSKSVLLIDQIKRKPKEYFNAFTSTFVSYLLLFNCLYRWHFFSNTTGSKVYRLGN